ncbi:WW domain-containing protein [Entamoeba marina]
MAKVNIVLTHPGHIAGEPIRETKSVKNVFVNIFGISHTYYTHTVHYTTTNNGRTEHHTRTETIYVNNDVYRSPGLAVIDEKHGTSSSLEQELAPGVYTFPFVVAFPDNLPPSTSIGGGRVYLQYYMTGTITYSNNSAKTSDPVRIPLCITPKRHPPQPAIMSDNDKNIEFKLNIADNCPSVGDSLQLNLSCTNHHDKKPVKISLNLLSKHEFRNTRLSVASPLLTFNEIPPRSTSSINGALTIPIDMPTTTDHLGFNISTFLIVSAKGAASFEKIFPIRIGADITNPSMMSARSQIFGMKRNFSTAIGFYGSHFRAPPLYRDIITSNLPKGIERIVSEDDDVEYYVNHFNRTTSLLPDAHSPCDLPYPLYNSALLPPGWSIASSYGELFFVNHDTMETTWIDPRPPNERFIPHIRQNVKGKLKVEVLKAVGLCALGRNVPDPYVGMIGADGKMVKTDSYKDKLDIKFDKKTNWKLNYCLLEQIIGSDVFMGGVNIDLQYFPPDVVIEDWFSLSCFGDKSRTITGKLLLRVCYRVNHNIEPPVISIKGHSPLNHPYYPDSLPMREQIEKQQKMREKHKMGDTPMINYEGVVMCRNK